MAYEQLKQDIAAYVKQNGEGSITGDGLQAILIEMVNSLGTGYKYIGVATPSTSAGTPSSNVFYLGGAGTYANFGTTFTVPNGSLAVIYYDTTWHNSIIRTDSDAFFNVNQYLGAPSTTYTKANARNAVPVALRSKGMIITYLTTNGWIIEQNLSTAGTWADDASWQTIGPVSVSQNSETGHIDITIGSETTPVASAEDVVQLEQKISYAEPIVDIDIDINKMSSNTALTESGTLTNATYHFTDLKYYPIFAGGKLNGKLRTLQSGGEYRPVVCFYSDTNEDSFVSFVRGNNQLSLNADVPTTAKYFRFCTVNEPGINIEYSSPLDIQLKNYTALLYAIGYLFGGIVSVNSVPKRDTFGEEILAFYLCVGEATLTNFLGTGGTPIDVSKSEVAIIRNTNSNLSIYYKETIPLLTKNEFNDFYRTYIVGNPNALKTILDEDVSTSISPIVSSGKFNVYVTGEEYELTLQSDDIINQTDISCWIENEGGSALSNTVHFGDSDLSKGITRNLQVVTISGTYPNCYLRFSTTNVESGKTFHFVLKKKFRKIGYEEYLKIGAIEDIYSSFDNYYCSVGLNQGGAVSQMCVAIGNNNMRRNTGIKNVTVGNDNMSSPDNVICSGSRNTSVGYHSLYRLTSGADNTAVGAESQDDTTEGSNNTSLGAYSLQRNRLGSDNVAIGKFALKGIDGQGGQGTAPNRTNSRNIAIGSGAMKNADDETNDNIAIGYKAMENVSSNRVGAIVIGNEVEADKDNQMKLGGSNITEVVFCGNKKVNFNNDGTLTWETVS